LRILHVTRDFPPQHSGGLSTAVAGLVTSLSAAEIDCVVVSFDDYRPSEEGSRNQPALRESAQGLVIIRVGPDVDLDSALELADAEQCGLVHLHHEGLWDFAERAATRRQVKIVTSVHVLQSEQDRLRGITSTKSTEAQRVALQKSAAIHAPSRAVTDLLCQGDPSLQSKIHTIGLGAQPWAISPKQAGTRAVSSEPLLLYVGRFADINGFQQFLAALPQLFAHKPALRAIAAGGLPGNKRGEKRWHKRWAQMAGDDAPRLEFLSWRGQDELSALYQTATMLIVPSWFETFGQVVLEGMLHRCPLLTTGTGGIGELVDHKSALLIKARNSDAISEGVLQILADPASAQARADRAYTEAQERAPWASQIPAFRELYRQVCD
jgi:glycogen(starch) synthase